MDLVAGRYAVQGHAGEGGLAVAHRALDLLHGDPVALKVLRRDADPERLRQEFTALMSCAHPHLVRARDFGWTRVDGVHRPFYAAEWIDGEALDAWWPSADDEARRAALIAILRALRALHRAGLRHGDVTAQNVRVDGTGRATLLDLSCVARLGEVADEVSGTPGHLAPELLRGHPADGRADLFALGVTLERLGPPAALAALAARLRAEEPGARPSDATEVLDALGARPEVDAVPVDAGPFVERDELLARFGTWLDGLAARRPDPPAFHLHGPVGAGRTRSLTELRWRAQLRVRTVEGLAALGASELLGRALGEAVGPGVEAQAEAAEALARRAEPVLLVMDEGPAAARLARLLPAGGAAGLLTAGADAIGGAHAEPLRPLSATAIARWAEAVGASHVSPEALRDQTGGLPGRLRDRLVRAAAGDDWRQPEQDQLAANAEAGPRAAVAACAWRGGASARQLARDTDDASVQRAIAAGWLRPEAGRVVAAARVAPGPDLAPLAARLADDLPAPARATAWLDAELPERARPLAAAWRSAPRAWLDVLARLDDPVALARASVAAGDLRRAERALERADESAPSRLARAELALKRARPRDVAALLEGLDGPEADDLRARAALARGAYEEARRLAQTAATAESPRWLAARLRETAALAAGYLGEDGADDALAEVARAHAALGDPAGQVRVASYRGILAHLAGDWAGAAERYERALAIAREHALDDALAAGWLNLGTARQEDGDWGGALEAYELGARYAVVLAQGGTEATLAFNLANLALEIGQAERARDLAASARASVRALGLTHLDVPLARLDAELALLGGDLARAAARARAARELAGERGAARDARELALLEGEIALRAGRLDEARAAARARAEDDGPDLTARGRLLRARVALAQGRSAEAIRHAERALRLASRHGHTLLAADAHRALARGYADDPELAAEHRAAAARAWRRIEATLPGPSRDAFRAHPRRAGLEPASPSPAAPARGAHAESPDERRLRRLLEINRQLTASLDPEDVLARAMDAAIELSGAERGFVLVDRAEAGLEVATARNLDREDLAGPQLEFSRSIAERVNATGEPVLTVDARHDPRFGGERSVHAMQLQSVACVPFRAPRGARGALYLDNRFQRGRFAEADLELLQAFADQVAIALTNAELHAALAARTEALDEARAALEARVEGQARAIESLSSEVEARQRALEYRYDYGRIIGRGPGMRAVLDTLERVIDVELPVLIRGESGTGKELVAKAIHFNGPRRERPMVSLNCAALPEALIESELFGHVRGAFTGADRDRRGLFVEAEGGTVFLDEIGEMPLSMQAKLLRALQEREVRPVGASAAVAFDVRVLSATNRDLRAEVAAGRFREDLFYRVAVVEVELPPLRARPEDLAALCDHLLAQHGARRLSAAALARLREHGWPGNVRELSNVLARAHAFADGDRIEPDDLGLSPVAVAPSSRESYAEDEAARIRRALLAHRWNVSRVSRELQIPRQTLYRRLRALGLTRPG